MTTSFAPHDAHARAAAVDEGLGRLYAAGTASDNIAITAYHLDGHLDPTFGENGVVLTFLPRVAIRDIAVDASHRIVVVGWVNDQLLIARYLPDGKLDPAFQGGLVQFGPYEYDLFHGFAVALDAKNRIVVSGEALRLGACMYPTNLFPALDGGMLVARFEPTGHPDLTFGSGTGFIIDNLMPGYCGDSLGVTWHHYEQARDVAIDDQGRIVVAGVDALDSQQTTADPPGVYDMRFMTVRRYLSDGQQDLTFGSNAPYGVTPFEQSSHANALLIDQLGRIVVAGQAQWENRSSFGRSRLVP